MGHWLKFKIISRDCRHKPSPKCAMITVCATLFFLPLWTLGNTAEGKKLKIKQINFVSFFTSIPHSCFFLSSPTHLIFFRRSGTEIAVKREIKFSLLSHLTLLCYFMFCMYVWKTNFVEELIFCHKTLLSLSSFFFYPYRDDSTKLK